MGKALLAMIMTVIVGFFGSGFFASFANAPEWGVVLAVAVMGGFIIYFNDKKK
ncbi:MAG: binding-protein-dependent transport permease [Oscillospiraceae bacterium]|nr:binding-protein-dependent transport permease [Oscillospiraceae bacterium]